MMGQLDCRVAIVTGGGRGIGRGEALALAAQGAAVVVNDMGGSWQGEGADDRAAADVCDEIVGRGGRASPNFSDISSVDGAATLIDQALDTYGRLDILVNNAGFLRDAMVFNADPDEWRSVVNVHLIGHFLTTRLAAAHWRAEAKEGRISPRTIVNTTSESGLFGNAAQSNYDAAKMGIVSMTIAVAKELQKYGVTVNAIAPRARTRLTSTTFENSSRAGEFETIEAGFDAMDPENIAPFVTFLATADASDITGQTFIVYGGLVAHVRMPHLSDVIVKEGRWTVEEIAERKAELFKELAPNHYEGPRGYARLPKQ
jgi:NAD(P)-dependent dehydrogenase (short-subunit alcohol dehydrogenase family)